MANNFDKNVSQIVLEKFLPGFMSDLVLTKSIDRQLLSGNGKLTPKTGDTIQFKRPHQFESERTDDGDVSGSTKNAFTSATATGSVGQYITVRVEYGQVEEALEMNQLDEMLMPVRDRMVTDLETEVAQRMNASAALICGDPNTAITKWSDIAHGSAFLKDMGISGQNFAAIDPWSATNLADAQGGLSSGSDSLVDRAWEDAQITQNFGGLKALRTNGLATYTAGADVAIGTGTVSATPTVTYTSAMKDTYELTVVLAGFTASTVAALRQGDMIQFDDTFLLNQQTKQPLFKDGAAIPFTGTVTADVDSDAGGLVTAVLSGAPFFDATNSQYNTVTRAITAADAVTILGGTTNDKIYKPSLFYNKMAFGLGTVDLPKLHSIDSAVVNNQGFSIRVHKYADGDANKQMMRFDILPSFCVFNPFMMGKLYGNP
ncbi:head protein [Candidatus Pacearchaeota archaeon]|nr:head protein [Candidatus Pacearchaeota archaeon]